MRNSLVILVLCLCSLTNAVPLGLKKNMAIVQEQEDPMLMMAEDETRPEMMISRLNLPSNATSIRADITDGFSCDNKTYGYYADVENDCQIFHVCLPVTYADGKENTFRWSFICPEETVFSQEYFTCMRSEDMSIDCEESFKYYELNRNFGMIEPEETPAEEADEEMNMEDMSRQPEIQGEEETNKPSIEAAPVKKQTVKVQNSNRRKTQANRVTVEGQRKKVQPVRRLPKPAVVATTAKPVVEESPAAEPEVERTTLKYQRLTKRPIAAIPAVEQPKPEEPKPEKEVFRQDLFAQKRKRPSFFPSRFDSVSQKDSDALPLPFLKTDVVLPKQPEPVVVQSLPESQAQASEIKEISIKPEEELKLSAEPEEVESLPIQKKEPAVVYIPVKEEVVETNNELKSDIAPLPENIPSQVEVVEIPIQKLDEPLRAEGQVVVAEVSAPEEVKPEADVVEPIKADEHESAEDAILKKIIAQIELTAPPLRPAADEEKPSQDSVQEPELVSLEEPEQSLQSLKSSELPKPIEVEVPEKMLEPSNAEKSSFQDEIPKDKLEASLPDAQPEILAKVEVPEPKPEEPSVNSELKEEAPIKESLKVEVPAPEKPQEPEVLLKIDAPIPEMPAPEAEIPKEESEDQKIQAAEIQSEESQKIEEPVPEIEAVVKSEIPEFKPLQPVEVLLPEKEMLVKTDTPASEPLVETPEETPSSENAENQEKQVEAEAEVPASNDKIIKIVEVIPEISAESVSKPIESPVELVKEEVQSSDEKLPEAQKPEQENIQPAADNDAQSLILDFISSLVNSENSNFEEQSAVGNELTSDSLPESSITDNVVAEVVPPNSQTLEEVLSLPSNQQMYQIPVQVIESPEPEPAVPVPVIPEPKLPLTVDDVVELVKESLDTPVEKENIVKEQLSNDDAVPQPNSEEVQPIYHRYVELGSNLLKSEALTAADSEPVVIATENEKSEKASEKEDAVSESTKASEKLDESAQLAPQSPEDSPVKNVEQLMVEEKPESLSEDSLKEGRSLNRFRMDPRKRRFLFRSDAR